MRDTWKCGRAVRVHSAPSRRRRDWQCLGDYAHTLQGGYAVRLLGLSTANLADMLMKSCALHDTRTRHGVGVG